MSEKKNNLIEGSLFVQERREKIIKDINTNGKIWVKDLSSKFGVSEVTIRQDLNELEKLGLVMRTYGGAIEISKNLVASPFTERINRRLEQKRAIAKAAFKLIENGDSIMLDCGTTILELANEIKLHQGLSLSVVVNFIPHIAALEDADNINLIVLGGSYESTERRMIGPLAASALDPLFVDKVFIGTNGVNIKNGVTSTSLLEADLRNKMIEHGKLRILMADSSKIGRSNIVSACPINKIDIIITDWEITKEECQDFKDVGIEVVIAEKD